MINTTQTIFISFCFHLSCLRFCVDVAQQFKSGNKCKTIKLDYLLSWLFIVLVSCQTADSWLSGGKGIATTACDVALNATGSNEKYQNQITKISGNIFLTATSNPLHLPLKTSPKAPLPMTSVNLMSVNFSIRACCSLELSFLDSSKSSVNRQSSNC